MTITIYTPAHVSTSSLNFRILHSPPRRTFSPARWHRNFSLSCALLPEKRRESRRSVTVALGVLFQWFLVPTDAGASPFDKYVKRKKLDPLETYIPAVLLAGVQIKELGGKSTHLSSLVSRILQHSRSFLKSPRCFWRFQNETLQEWVFSISHTHSQHGSTVELADMRRPIILGSCKKSLEVDQPKYGDCRNILRSGPASSLRVNIRAVAQYASDDGNGESASNDVDQCLSALEGLDSLLLRASRNDPGASIDSMKAKITTALNALDSLLKTVPADMLDKGKIVADSYFFADEEDVTPEKLDPNLKQLESIL